MDKFGLTNRKCQSFSLPLPFIRYIFVSRFSLPTFENLLQTCKTFKLWQLQTSGCYRIKKVLIYGYLSILRFYIFNNDETFKNCISGDINFYRIDGIISVMDCFEMLIEEQSMRNHLYSKLDLSATKKITLFENCSSLDLHEYNKLFQASVEHIEVNTCFVAKNNPIMVAFENCPKLHTLKIIRYGSDTVMNKAEFKKLLNFNQKMQSCRFFRVDELDALDVVKFVDTRLAEDGKISLACRNLEIFNDLKSKIKEISKNRRMKQLIRVRGVVFVFTAPGVAEKFFIEL